MTANYTVDLSDPRARELLTHGHLGGELTARQPRQVVHLAGDEEHGLSTSFNLASGKQEVIVLFKDLFMTVDVYAVPGEPLKIHLVCPKCHKTSVVSGERKVIDFEPLAVNPVRRAARASGAPGVIRLAELGKLSISTFECSWELGNDRHIQGAVHTGTTLCRQRLAIDNNVARDPRE